MAAAAPGCLNPGRSQKKPVSVDATGFFLDGEPSDARNDLVAQNADAINV